MIYKRIAAICFAISFILAMTVFSDYFDQFISKTNAKYGIIIFGGVALLMNLLAFKYNSNSESNNIIFWMGSIIVFIGLIFKMQNHSLNQTILIIGLLVLGLSYFYNPFKKKDSNNDELLDN